VRPQKGDNLTVGRTAEGEAGVSGGALNGLKEKRRDQELLQNIIDNIHSRH
jgi:hypothetical protein